MNPAAIAVGLGAAAGCAALATAASTFELLSQRRRRVVIVTASIAAGILSALSVMQFDDAVFLALTIDCVTVVGVAAAAVDVLEGRLPTALLAPGPAAVAGLLAAEAIQTGDAQPLIRAVAGGVACFAFHLGLALATRGGLGAGDVKLAGLLGLALARIGWSTLLVGILLAWLAAAVFVLARRPKPGRRAIVVMGPFLLAGFAAAILGWGSM